MFNRQALKELISWSIKTNRKPLVLRGARQVGKTTLVKLLANQFDNYLEFNLDRENEKALFESKLPFNEFITTLFLYKKKRNQGRTLIFIDEIQNSPEAVALLRYFYEETPDIYVISAGSLLETLINSHISFPVGRVEYMAIRPLSFVDFLEACGEEQAHEILLSEQIPAYAHETLQKLFRTYTLIGGMPEIVAHYREHHDITALKNIYTSLVVSYRDDVEKYSQSTAAANYIRHIINSAFYEAGNRVTFEKFGNSVYRSREIKEAFVTLEKTMLLKLIYPATSTNLPFVPDYKKKPRLHVLDTGFVNYISNTQIELISSQNIEDVYRGRIAEHIVGQELLAYDYSVLSELHFWTRDKHGSDAEVDYLYLYNGLVIPIEVKSGSGGRLRSLHQFIDAAPHAFGVRIYSGNYKIESEKTLSGKEFTLINLPFYMLSRIETELKKVIG